MGEQTAIDHKWKVLAVAGADEERELLGCERPGCLAMAARVDGQVVDQVMLFGEPFRAVGPCEGGRGAA